MPGESLNIHDIFKTAILSLILYPGPYSAHYIIANTATYITYIVAGTSS